MSFLLRFKSFWDELEQAKYYRVVGIGITVIAFLFAVLFYIHAHKIKTLQDKIKVLNKERKKAREFLEQHEQVKQQQDEIREVLAQDRTFKIQQYFDKILNELRLQNKLSKPTEVAEPQDLKNGFNEIRLDASFTALTMQDLVQLLQKIEEARRIYIKDLEIAKETNTIAVTLVIATLQPQT